MRAEVTMCTSGLLLLLLLLASPPVQPSPLPQPNTPETKATRANQLLSAMEKVVHYMDGIKDVFNLTEIVSIMITKEELKGAVNGMALDPVLQPLIQRTESLSLKVDALFNKSIHYLKEIDPGFLKDFQPVTQSGFWKLPIVWIPTNAALIYQFIQHPESLLDDPNDQCMKDMLGTSMNSNLPCSYSEFCKKLVTATGATEAYLTHQMFYFLTSGMVGCTEGMFSTSEYYKSVYCANMLRENQNVVAGNSTFVYQDLFMENIMFCGLAGYLNFYNYLWMDDVLSWVLPHTGCFGLFSFCTAQRSALGAAVMGGFLYALSTLPQLPETPSQATGYSTTMKPTHS